MEEWKKEFNEASALGRWTLRTGFFKVVLPLMLFAVAVGIAGNFFGWFGEAASVARQEFGTKEMLRKYEWFKDASAQLDKKQADIEVYKSRLQKLASDYQDIPRYKWDRTDKEQANLWQQEVAGVIASYNSLAAEYNSQMSKINWRFANVGSLPEGATSALPKAYKTYIQ